MAARLASAPGGRRDRRHRYEFLTPCRCTLPSDGATSDGFLRPWVKSRSAGSARVEQGDVIEALEAEARTCGSRHRVGQGRHAHNGTCITAHLARWSHLRPALRRPVRSGRSLDARPTRLSSWLRPQDRDARQYSFYNPSTIPLRSGQRADDLLRGYVFFTFSGSEEAATPRSDYTRIMHV